MQNMGTMLYFYSSKQNSIYCPCLDSSGEILFSRNTASQPMPVDSSHQQQNNTLDSDMYGCTLCYHHAMRQCIYSQASSAQRKTMTLLLCPFLVLHSPSSDVSAEVTDISCSFSHKLTRINRHTSHINLCMLYDITITTQISAVSFGPLAAQ